MGFDDAAEDRILSVEAWRVLVDDEELAAAGIAAALVGHRDDTACVGEVAELAPDFVAGTATAHEARIGIARSGVPGLNHESRNHAVERDAHIEILLGEFDEVFDGLRSDFGQQFDPDAPEVSDLDDRVGVRAFGDQILRGHGLFDRDGFFAARGEEQADQ